MQKEDYTRPRCVNCGKYINEDDDIAKQLKALEKSTFSKKLRAREGLITQFKEAVKQLNEQKYDRIKLDAFIHVKGMIGYPEKLLFCKGKLEEAFSEAKGYVLMDVSGGRGNMYLLLPKQKEGGGMSCGIMLYEYGRSNFWVDFMPTHLVAMASKMMGDEMHSQETRDQAAAAADGW